MAMIKRHTDVVASMDEFTSNYEAGLYVAPWIVYVGNDTDGYSVIYSNDEKKDLAGMTPDFIDSLKNRIEALETEKVFCFEEEYDILVANGIGWVTNLDGSRSEVVYDESKMYFIYEDEGPTETPEEPTPDEPETPTEPDQPEEPTPDEPETPTEPDQPEEPTPDEPENGEQPEEPTPDEPENGEQPEEPNEPEEPTPDEPENDQEAPKYDEEAPENNNGTNESIGEGEGESEVTPETDPEEKTE